MTDVFYRHIQIFTHFNIVAAFLHGNGDAYGCLTVEIHFWFGRISIFPADLGNIAKTEDFAIGLYRYGAYVCQGVGRTCQAKVNVIAVAFQSAAGQN